MRLIHKFTIVYLIITFFVLIIGGVLAYKTVKSEVDNEQARYLKKNIDFTISEITRGVIPDSLSQHRMEIRRLGDDQPETPFFVRDTLVWHGYLKRMEPQVKVSVSRVINGQHFYISTYGAVVDTEDITNAVVKAISGIFIIMLVVTGLVSILISKKILKPFNRTLKAMQSFRLRQKEPLILPETTTTEFKRLTLFLKKMTTKAQSDYKTLKEFSENASHEMQTPLAIIMGKLELLLNSDIDDRQAKLIISAHNAVEKLSKMGQSLTFLTKLENREFESPENINLSKLVTDSLFAFQELIEMKSLRLDQEIEDNVEVNMHPILSDILLNNLLSNAIRHNNENGLIEVKLSGKVLRISNTGDPLEVEGKEMFKRFIKHNQSSDSIGLGLAIVKQICEQSNIEIQYVYKEGMHTLQLEFPS